MTSGSILRGLWLFVRANPATIAGWAILYLVFNLLLRAGLTPFYRAQFAAAIATARGLPPPPPPVGTFLLVWALAMVGLLILVAALWRAVLFPAERRFLYLRVGADEARLLGLIAAGFVASLLIGIAIAIGATVLGLLVGLGAFGSRSWVGIVMIVLVLTFWAVGLWLSVRLSLIGPLTVARRRIAIREGWDLAKGRFRSLFGAYLAIWLVAIVVTLALVLPRISGLMTSSMRASAPGMRIEMARFQAEQMAVSAEPGALVSLLVGTVVGILFHVAVAGAPAVAVAQLIDERAGLR